MNRRSRVMVALGTRPEAVKLAPVIKGLAAAEDFSPVVVVTGQHRAILDEVLELFGIVPDHDLDLLRERQSLTHVTVSALEGVGTLVDDVRPDAVVVQGDTTTTFAASLAAFYRQVPVVHVEAGLRSGDPLSPFPEELNRQMTSRLASLHLCPTDTSRENLLREGIDGGRVVVTGNTVVDALRDVLAMPVGPEVQVVLDRLAPAPASRRPRMILVTAHRRESWGQGLTDVAAALRDVVESRDDVRVVFPIHPNPVVREAMIPVLDGVEGVTVVEPLGYEGFARLMDRADLVVTDSGGIQEEAPSLGIPVLVTRPNTERPEAVDAGTVALVGNDRATVAGAILRLLDDPRAYERMRRAVNPYGDGKAAPRVVQSLRHLLRGGELPAAFRPPPSGAEAG